MSIKRSICTSVAGFLAALLVLAAGCTKHSNEIRVLSDRTEDHLTSIFEQYTKATGVKIKAVFVEEGLISRLENRPTEADLVITKDAGLLEIARTKGLLQPLGSKRIEQVVPAEYRSADGTYFSDAYRARAIFYSKERVLPEELSSYESLTDPKWHGRVCIRSGYQDYNLNVFSQMYVKQGEAHTREFLTKLAGSLARRPTGNDRAQAQAISEGVCDVTLANSYYMGIMLSSPEQRPWGEATRVFFPDQDGCGSYILRSGLALTKSRNNVAAARALLEYMVQPGTQDFITKLTYQYPVLSGRPMPEANRHLGEAQPQVKNGVFKVCRVPLKSIAAAREKVIHILDEIRFDQHP